MGLPWIKIAVDAPSHPKVFALAQLLSVSPAEAFGLIATIWTWAARVQPSGTILRPGAVRVTSSDRPRDPNVTGADLIIEIAAGWRGDRGALVSALVDVGLLDQVEHGFRLHDWDEYAGAFSQKAEKDRERKRRQRERKAIAESDGRPRDVRVTAPEVAATSRGIPRVDVDREGDIEGEEDTATAPAAACPRPDDAIVQDQDHDQGSDAPPEKPKKPRAPATGRHAETIALFARLFLETHGREYRVTAGAADGAATKKLLAWPEATEAEIERRIRIALADAFFMKRPSIHGFVANWNAWGIAVKKAGTYAPQTNDFKEIGIGYVTL